MVNVPPARPSEAGQDLMACFAGLACHVAVAAVAGTNAAAASPPLLRQCNGEDRGGGAAIFYFNF